MAEEDFPAVEGDKLVEGRQDAQEGLVKARRQAFDRLADRLYSAVAEYLITAFRGVGSEDAAKVNAASLIVRQQFLIDYGDNLGKLLDAIPAGAAIMGGGNA